MTAYRHHSAQPTLRPGSVAIAYAGLDKAVQGCAEQPAAPITTFRAFQVDPVAGLDMQDLRQLSPEKLRRLALRVSMVLQEKASSTTVTGGVYSRMRVEVIPGRFVPAPVAAIMRLAADEAKITVPEMLGRSKADEFALPRQRAMASCREVRLADGTNAYSYPEVGTFFGRDHSTVIHAWNRVPPEDRIVL